MFQFSKVLLTAVSGSIFMASIASATVLTFRTTKPSYIGDIYVTLESGKVVEISAYLALDRGEKSFKPKCENKGSDFMCGMIAEESGSPYLFGGFLFSTDPKKTEARFFQDDPAGDFISYERALPTRESVNAAKNTLENDLAPFLGAFKAVGGCEFSGTKARAYVTLSADKKSLVLSLYGEDAARVEIPLGTGTRPSIGSNRRDASEKYATKIAGGSITSVIEYFIGTQSTGSDRTDIKLNGKRLSLTSKSTFLPKASSCLFERK